MQPFLVLCALLLTSCAVNPLDNHNEDNKVNGLDQPAIFFRNVESVRLQWYYYLEGSSLHEVVTDDGVNQNCFDKGYSAPFELSGRENIRTYLENNTKLSVFPSSIPVGFDPFLDESTREKCFKAFSNPTIFSRDKFDYAFLYSTHKTLIDGSKKKAFVAICDFAMDWKSNIVNECMDVAAKADL